MSSSKLLTFVLESRDDEFESVVADTPLVGLVLEGHVVAVGVDRAELLQSVAARQVLKKKYVFEK